MKFNIDDDFIFLGFRDSLSELFLWSILHYEHCFIKTIADNINIVDNTSPSSVLHNQKKETVSSIFQIILQTIDNKKDEVSNNQFLIYALDSNKSYTQFLYLGNFKAINHCTIKLA